MEETPKVIIAYQWLIRQIDPQCPPFVTASIYSEESIRDRYGNRVIRPIKETKIPIPVRD